MKKLLASGLLMVLGVTMANAAYKNFVIQDKTGNEQITLVSNVQKLTFDETNLYVKYVGDSTKTHSLESINKIYFAKFLSIKDESVAKYDLVLYPNPAMESISIKGLTAFPTECAIYDISGNKIKSISLIHDSQLIPINDLAVGVYFIKIDQQIRKFEKYEK